MPASCRRFEAIPSASSNAAHADVVRDAAVHEMEVWPLDCHLAVTPLLVLERRESPAQQGRGGSRGLSTNTFPKAGTRCLQRAAVVVQRDGRQHYRHRRRRRRSARQVASRSRSEQITSKTRWLKTKPDRRSRCRSRMRRSTGPSPRSRSPNVAPLNRISSYNSAASSDRPQPVDPSVPQSPGLTARARRARPLRRASENAVS